MSTHPLFAPAEPLSIASLHAATDPIAIADLDEDWAVPCERWAKRDCDCPSEWVMWTTKCCADRWPAVTMCTPHKDEALAGERGWCTHCGEVFLPMIAAFTLIEPLNRRTT